MENMKGNDFAWLFLGIPALLGWIGLGLAYLLAPHLAVEPQPLIWALYASGGWYCLMIALFGGWLGLFAVGSMF